MSFGLFSSGAGVQTRCEFVRMKGPQGKGHAEMAVTKPKGSGVETPTSEPGYIVETCVLIKIFISVYVCLILQLLRYRHVGRLGGGK